jgi:hypothetical protein
MGKRKAGRNSVRGSSGITRGSRQQTYRPSSKDSQAKSIPFEQWIASAKSATKTEEAQAANLENMLKILTAASKTDSRLPSFDKLNTLGIFLSFLMLTSYVSALPTPPHETTTLDSQASDLAIDFKSGSLPTRRLLEAGPDIFEDEADRDATIWIGNEEEGYGGVYFKDSKICFAPYSDSPITTEEEIELQVPTTIDTTKSLAAKLVMDDQGQKIIAIMHNGEIGYYLDDGSYLNMEDYTFNSPIIAKADLGNAALIVAHKSDDGIMVRVFSFIVDEIIVDEFPFATSIIPTSVSISATPAASSKALISWGDATNVASLVLDDYSSIDPDATINTITLPTTVTKAGNPTSVSTADPDVFGILIPVQITATGEYALYNSDTGIIPDSISQNPIHTIGKIQPDTGNHANLSLVSCFKEISGTPTQYQYEIRAIAYDSAIQEFKQIGIWTPSDMPVFTDPNVLIHPPTVKCDDGNCTFLWDTGDQPDQGPTELLDIKPTVQNTSQSITCTAEETCSFTTPPVIESLISAEDMTANVTFPASAMTSVTPGSSGSSSANYNSDTGVLTISGTIAEVNTAIAGTTWKITEATTGPITFGFSAIDGAEQDSTSTDSMTVTVQHKPVVATDVLNALDVSEGNTPVTVAPDLEVTDVDSANLNGAEIWIDTAYVAGEDVLAFTAQAGIIGNFNTETGKLTLSGTATIADYQIALRSITYQNTNTNNPSTTPRSISFKAIDDQDLASTVVAREITINYIAEPSNGSGPNWLVILAIAGVSATPYSFCKAQELFDKKKKRKATPTPEDLEEGRGRRKEETKEMTSIADPTASTPATVGTRDVELKIDDAAVAAALKAQEAALKKVIAEITSIKTRIDDLQPESATEQSQLHDIINQLNSINIDTIPISKSIKLITSNIQQIKPRASLFAIKNQIIIKITTANSRIAEIATQRQAEEEAAKQEALKQQQLAREAEAKQIKELAEKQQTAKQTITENIQQLLQQIGGLSAQKQPSSDDRTPNALRKIRIFKRSLSDTTKLLDTTIQLIQSTSFPEANFPAIKSIKTQLMNLQSTTTPAAASSSTLFGKKPLRTQEPTLTTSTIEPGSAPPPDGRLRLQPLEKGTTQTPLGPDAPKP